MSARRLLFRDLSLLDPAGDAVSLETSFDRFLLIILLRPLACLACQEHLGEVARSKAEFDRRGISVAVISFAKPPVVARYQQEMKWPFPIFADPTRSTY